MAKRFGQLAAPCMITSVVSYLIMTINVVFAGQMTEDSAAKIAGVSLGNMFLGMFCRHIVCSGNAAVETFVSHAFGQG